MAKLRWGFKSKAEKISLGIRKDLGLDVTDPLKPLKLAEHLGVRVAPLTDLAAYGLNLGTFGKWTSGWFSAMTLFNGPSTLIIYNPSEPTSRKANSLAHELSHIILKHPPPADSIEGSNKKWISEHESEADWLAAALLVPRDGAFRWLRSGNDLSSGARHFGVSESLFQWRVNNTGIHYQLARLRQAYRS